MKKTVVILFLYNLIQNVSIAQNYYQSIDSLNNSRRDSIMYILASPNQDTTRVNLLNDMCNYFKFNRPDSALYYGYEAISLARQIKFPDGEVRAMGDIALSHSILGNFSKGLQIILQGIKIADKNNLAFRKALLLILLGSIYRDTEDYNNALSIYKEALILLDSLNRADFSIVTRSYIGNVYLKINQYDSALYYNQLAYDDAVRLNNNWVSNIALIQIGKLQEKLGNTSLALSYFRQATEKANTSYWLFQSYYSIALFYQHTGMIDSCIYYTRESLEISQRSGIFSNIIDASILLADIYDKSDSQKALEYNKMAMAYKDSIYNIGNNVAFEYFTAFNEQERQYELDAAKTEFRNRVRMNAFLGSTFTLIVIAIFLFRNNRQKQKSKQNIEKAYDQLKSTQTQLIQAEKMASLGELTAGIAHEIQNPLNFVNNFSEVNRELLEELLEELDNGNKGEIKTIAADIIQNEEKINHHGRRAESIVKNMLLHSRGDEGQKVPADVNPMIEEYANLAFHGMRARDKSFQADYKFELDKKIPPLNVVPQDIGRVFLNLVNNAFYAVSDAQKKKVKGSEAVESFKSDTEAYKPEVVLSSKMLGGKVEISVQDNGEGIPEDIRDKILQPFFTTKHAGQGTGLGLSLSYDIIKAHGGELKVETREGEGSKFIITLPIKS